MTDWGPFLRTARHQRGWTQLRAVEEMQRYADIALPSPISLMRTWKRWEKGTHPGAFYDRILRRMFPPPPPEPPVPNAPHPALE